MRVLANMAVHGSLGVVANVTELPAEAQLGTIILYNNQLCAYMKVDGMDTWYPLSPATRAYVHNQSVAAQQWTVQHNLDSNDLWYMIQDSTGTVMLAEITVVDADSFTVDLTESMTGKVIVVAPNSIDVPVVKATLMSVQTVEALAITKNGVDVPNETEVQNQINQSQIYDIAFSINGKPDASEVLARLVVNRAFHFPIGMTNSIGNSGVNATSTSAFSMRKNGVQFGICSFTSAGAIAGFTAETVTNFVAGDVLTVVAPAIQDSTLADLAFTLSGLLDF